MKELNPKLHWDGKEWRFDTSASEEWYGPNQNFKIVDAGIENGSGGYILIELPGDRYIKYVHFTEMNWKVFDACEKGYFLSAGTYLGSTKEAIGYTTGPHLHVEGWLTKNKITTNINRYKIIEWINERR